MIPSIVARQVRETLLDYLKTTFSLADRELEAGLFSFLDGDDGLFRGPYYDVRLPFRKVLEGERSPLDIAPDFAPYRHQQRAFQRLYSKGGHQPQHTLVTTGTGSGKTECFLYPILDHCWRNREQRGIKAVVLYPMNALASDQARRLARLLWDDARLRGQVTAGLYVGGAGQYGAADRDHLVDQRDVLRASPPDILLTNYKMLDFLLLRPEDRRLWRNNGPDSLRYLVLDELHTYDGAQGSDVACLVRRLKHRIGAAPGSVCCVGTSATLGGEAKQKAVLALTGFAQTVFGEDFFEDSVITEDRCEVEEALGREVDAEAAIPAGAAPEELDPAAFPDAESWVARQLELWLGEGGAALSPVELGRRLERHDFLRQLLKVQGTAGPVEWRELDALLLRRLPEWEGLEAVRRRRLFESFLALVSRAKRPAPTAEDPDRVEPFLTVQVQLWVRELRSLVRKVKPPGEALELAWADVRSPQDLEREGQWLPIAHCRECGGAGFASYQRANEAVLQTDLKGIGQRWYEHNRWCRYVAFGADGSDGFPLYLCPVCLSFDVTEVCGCGGGERPRIPVRVEATVSQQAKPRFRARCPDCDSPGALSMLGSRAPSLLSVAISHLFLTDYNQDKKLLAFTDSVQDASHRAGFFGARTYRFNLRTAIQGAIEAAPEPTPLTEIADRMLATWGERLEPARLVATLWPADLQEHPAYEAFLERGGRGRHPRLDRALRERLGWEVTMELGLASRVGRTLETTLCSTALVEPEAVGRAARLLALELDEDPLLDAQEGADLSAATLQFFLEGLLHRQRGRGGVFHPFLEGYAKNNGKWFLLTKRKQPLISPFGSHSVLPRFLTDRSAEGSDREPVFDAIVSSGRAVTWFRDWAARVLRIAVGDTGINQLYRRAVQQLQAQGVLVEREIKGGGSAWAIDPARLLLVAGVANVECDACLRTVPVTAETAAAWEGRPCLQYRCPGRLRRRGGEVPSYYQRIYRSGRLERIFPHEHTGLLEREERERVEEEFKSGTAPAAVNLFVSTPTLEMGIDIGDLSAAVLCSVPPSPANYLQRVGRAGRETGNAFCFTLANSRPHDLYFQAEPSEMLAGQVLPPGCFIDAPEMLKRQLVAFAMDGWARDEEEKVRIPPRVSLLLPEGGGAAFPGRFLAYWGAGREAIVERFLAAFSGEVSADNEARLRELAAGGWLPELVLGAFAAVRGERDELRKVLRRVKTRLQELEADPEGVDDLEYEKGDAQRTYRVVQRLLQEVGAKYPLNVLTDAGVLPNYAFPEAGVRLESVVSEQLDGGQRRYEAYEYVRPASVALRELAPFNTFYADGRKVRIDEVDIGTRAQPLVEKWRLCPRCNHAAPELEEVQSTVCPRCSDAGWADTGQVRALLPFRRSRSLASRLEASTADDTDEREEASYQTLTLIDVGKENWNGARLIADLPFGWELLKRQPLREINFGPRAEYPSGLEVAEEPIIAYGFPVCEDCGRVKDERSKVNHAAYCRTRKAGAEEKLNPLFLYREMESEAIRILLPVSDVEVESKRASFKAALELGFRRRFQGNPGHLLVKEAHEPAPGGRGRRQFLVIYDAVPGGTGYLAELWRGESFLGVLEMALKALETCACQRKGQDGCYRCLFAYQVQRDLALISSREAQELLRRVLARKDEVVDVTTLSEVSLETLLESELEERFLKALERFATEAKGASWEAKVQGGEERWVLRFADGPAWEVRAQVDLGPGDGVAVTCRPDFVLRQLGGEEPAEAVAVFCDGFAYHALPEEKKGRIADDVVKRGAILGSGRYRVWSVTWQDLNALDQEKKNPEPAVLLGGVKGQLFSKAASAAGLDIDKTLGSAHGMAGLLAYLRRPERGEWEKLARVHAFAWLAAGPFLGKDDSDRLEVRLVGEPARFAPGPLAAEPPPGSASGVISRFDGEGWLHVLARASAEDLRRGQLDGARVIVRLYDEAEGRSAEGFQLGWRRFLQGWNLLQFHPGLEVVTSEGIAEGYGPFVAPSRQLAEVAEVELTPDEERSVELAELLELSTDEARVLIEALVEALGGAGLPLPELDHELRTSAPGVGPEADLAWPAQRVAVLAARQREGRGAFERAGWTVFEHPVEPGQLIAALAGRQEEVP